MAPPFIAVFFSNTLSVLSSDEIVLIAPPLVALLFMKEHPTMRVVPCKCKKLFEIAPPDL